MIRWNWRRRITVAREQRFGFRCQHVCCGSVCLVCSGSCTKKVERLREFWLWLLSEMLSRRQWAQAGTQGICSGTRKNRKLESGQALGEIVKETVGSSSLEMLKTWLRALSTWLCFKQGVGLNNPPTSVMLRFCDQSIGERLLTSSSVTRFPGEWGTSLSCPARGLLEHEVLVAHPGPGDGSLAGVVFALTPLGISQSVRGLKYSACFSAE